MDDRKYTDEYYLYLVKYWDTKSLKNCKVRICASSIPIAVEIAQNYAGESILVETVKLLDDGVIVQK